MTSIAFEHVDIGARNISSGEVACQAEAPRLRGEVLDETLAIPDFIQGKMDRRLTRRPAKVY